MPKNFEGEVRFCPECPDNIAFGDRALQGPDITPAFFAPKSDCSPRFFGVSLERRGLGYCANTTLVSATAAELNEMPTADELPPHFAAEVIGCIARCQGPKGDACQGITPDKLRNIIDNN